MQLVVTYRNIYSRLGKVGVTRVKRRKARIGSPRVSGMLVGAAAVRPSPVCRRGKPGAAETRSGPGAAFPREQSRARPGPGEDWAAGRGPRGARH